MSRAARRGWRYRGNVAVRVLAATAGAYGVAALFAMAGARLLPMSRIEAVLSATMLAFALLPAVAIWVFLARTPLRAVIGVAGMALVLGLAAWAAGPP